MSIDKPKPSEGPEKTMATSTVVPEKKELCPEDKKELSKKNLESADWTPEQKSLLYTKLWLGKDGFSYFDDAGEIEQRIRDFQKSIWLPDTYCNGVLNFKTLEKAENIFGLDDQYNPSKDWSGLEETTLDADGNTLTVDTWERLLLGTGKYDGQVYNTKTGKYEKKEDFLTSRKMLTEPDSLEYQSHLNLIQSLLKKEWANMREIMEMPLPEGVYIDTVENNLCRLNGDIHEEWRAGQWLPIWASYMRDMLTDKAGDSQIPSEDRPYEINLDEVFEGKKLGNYTLEELSNIKIGDKFLWNMDDAELGKLGNVGNIMSIYRWVRHEDKEVIGKLSLETYRAYLSNDAKAASELSGYYFDHIPGRIGDPGSTYMNADTGNVMEKGYVLKKTWDTYMVSVRGVDQTNFWKFQPLESVFKTPGVHNLPGVQISVREEGGHLLHTLFVSPRV
jgi:hypothetical protein